MGPMVIVIVTPGRDQRLGVRDGFKAVHVEALVSEAAVETFDKCVLHGLAGPNEVQRNAATVGPFVERLRREFSAVIDRDRLGQWPTRGQRLKRVDHALAGQGNVGLQ